MSGINLFVSYRRGESQASWLKDQLDRYFGRKHVFRDFDSIAPGDDFEQTIEERLNHCDAVLALIGPKWISGIRRLADPADFLRRELLLALAVRDRRRLQRARSDLLILPILVGGAAFPSWDASDEGRPAVDAVTGLDQLSFLRRLQVFEFSEKRRRYDRGRLVQAICKGCSRGFFTRLLHRLSYRARLALPWLVLVLAAVLAAAIALGLANAGFRKAQQRIDEITRRTEPPPIEARLGGGPLRSRAKLVAGDEVQLEELLTALGPLTALRELDLSDTAVAELAVIGRLTGLEVLDLSGSYAEDLGPLASLHRLEVLRIARTDIDNLAPLAGLSRLATLDLSYSAVDELSDLENLQRLEKLNLVGSRVRARDQLASLALLPRLRLLLLEAGELSDLLPLRALTGLERLCLHGFQGSEEAFASLQQALATTEVLPDCPRAWHADI